MIAGNTGNVVCNTSFTAKQHKRPDMNGNLRLALPWTTSQERSGNLTGTTVEQRHPDYPLISHKLRALSLTRAAQ